MRFRFCRFVADSSKENRRKSIRRVAPKSPKNPSWAVLGAQSRFGDASGRVQDGFWTPKCCPRTDLGSLRTSQKRSRAVQKHAGASQTRSKFLRDNFQDARKVVRVAKRSRKRSRIDFGVIFGQCAEAPKCISYWFLQCFFDVGCFARRMFVERKNVEKTVVLDSKIEAGGVPGRLGRTSLGAKTAKSGKKARSKCLRGLRKFISGRERSNFERESATRAPEERAGARASELYFRNLRMHFKKLFKNIFNIAPSRKVLRESSHCFL